MQTDEIHALVRHAQDGDEAAKAALLETFRPLIHAAAGQRHLAPVREDAEQEAALALFLAISRFDEGRGVPFAGFAKAMIYGQMRTLFKQERRKWQREIMPETDGEAADFFGEIADERDEIESVNEAETFHARLAALPERDRQILTMHYEKGLPLAAIGLILGMSENYVAVCKTRAIKKLRERMGAESKDLRARKIAACGLNCIQAFDCGIMS